MAAVLDSQEPQSTWDPMDWHPSDPNVDDTDNHLWGLPRCLEEIWWRVDHGMDSIVLFDGEEGLGKSTAAITLAKMLQRGDPFDVSRVAFGVRQMVGTMHQAEPGTVVQADEVVEGFQAREAMSEENKLGQKWVQTCRDRHIILLVAYPSLWDLDIYLREHRVAYRVYIGWDRLKHKVILPDGRTFRKGARVRMAKIYERGKNAWKREAYWKKRAQFIFDPMDDDPIYQAMKAKKRDHTNKLADRIADNVGSKATKKAAGKNGSQTNQEMTLVTVAAKLGLGEDYMRAAALSEGTDMTQSEIADLIGTSQPSVSKMLKELNNKRVLI